MQPHYDAHSCAFSSLFSLVLLFLNLHSKCVGLLPVCMIVWKCAQRLSIMILGNLQYCSNSCILSCTPWLKGCIDGSWCEHQCPAACSQTHLSAQLRPSPLLSTMAVTGWQHASFGNTEINYAYKEHVEFHLLRVSFRGRRRRERRSCITCWHFSALQK